MAEKFTCAKCGKKIADSSTGSATLVATQDLTPGESLTTLLWCRDVLDADGNVTAEGCGTKILKGVNTAAWRAAQTPTAVKAQAPAKRARKTKTA